jgi:hypothetical protein
VVEALLADPRYATTRQEWPWVGRAESVEARIVAREGLTFYGVEAGALHGARLLAVPRSLWRLWRGYRQARRLFAEFPSRCGALDRRLRVGAGDPGSGTGHCPW